MSGSDEKGKFSTDIAQDVIEQALESVRKRTGEDPASEPAAESDKDKEIADLKAQLELSMEKGRELMGKIKEEHEKVLRAVADLENFKKRAAKEKEEVQKFGTEKLLKDFLPVVDNLDRALEHAKGSTDFESLKQGVAMTRKLFEDTLGKHGVKAFSALGQAFDPRFHEAMQQVETTELPPNQVVSEILRGYTLNDRLVRPAMVMVSKAPAAAEPPSEEPDIK
ncbi:MAG: nucleotide exchange factor GrpE [Myxococcota bacterium]